MRWGLQEGPDSEGASECVKTHLEHSEQREKKNSPERVPVEPGKPGGKTVEPGGVQSDI